jgi:hypothetical protein
LRDGTHPKAESLKTPLDSLRILKNDPRPLIEEMRDASRLGAGIVDELTALLPDR